MDTDTVIQARIADDIEAAAYRDMYAAAPEKLVSVLSLRSMQFDDATVLMADGITDPLFSRVIGLGNSGVVSDEQIEQIVNAYREARIGSFWMHVNPIVAPRNLGARLEQRQFKAPKRHAWAKMIRDAAPAPNFESPFEIRLAKESERAATSIAMTTAFGMPAPFATWIQNMATREQWTLIAALDGANVVGGGLLYIEDQLAWLGLGGVLPEARGRNAHRAIMAQRIAIAIERGCSHIATETGEPINNEPNPSLRNMYRCGFTRACSRLNYASPG